MKFKEHFPDFTNESELRSTDNQQKLVALKKECQDMLEIAQQLKPRDLGRWHIFKGLTKGITCCC